MHIAKALFYLYHLATVAQHYRLAMLSSSLPWTTSNLLRRPTKDHSMVIRIPVISLESEIAIFPAVKLEVLHSPARTMAYMIPTTVWSCLNCIADVSASQSKN
ncbi:hypothetical protein SERLADRAFT_456401 [Serpula lacrymans var. lacrymans S7.9]|uniref:Uncharacterized protein n=1 Tax=Serpula lacrymans var. lacrymans (strain S7.9) TaxID=578457 RepID=F8NGK5_SERL9|nr:uncharacterized protein SERLADRAFT_456401 [Serpula lacrymans var. lacrymans S7.9]EGO29087.1 hypothetical protein SERLADRAFT_456401 [Serpula lacrymans var. lacrymans S7.9]